MRDATDAATVAPEMRDLYRGHQTTNESKCGADFQKS